MLLKREDFIFPLKKGNKRGCTICTKSIINNPLTPFTKGECIVLFVEKKEPQRHKERY